MLFRVIDTDGRIVWLNPQHVIRVEEAAGDSGLSYIALSHSNSWGDVCVAMNADKVALMVDQALRNFLPDEQTAKRLDAWLLAQRTANQAAAQTDVAEPSSGPR